MMDFREAMGYVAKGRVVRVAPASGDHPFLVKIDFFEGLDGEGCLQCRCLTKDGLYLEPGYGWEPVCGLLCYPDYLDGKWDVVNEKDFKEVVE